MYWLLRHKATVCHCFTAAWYADYRWLQYDGFSQVVDGSRGSSTSGQAMSVNTNALRATQSATSQLAQGSLSTTVRHSPGYMKLQTLIICHYS